MARKKGFMSRSLFEKVIDECAKHKTPIRLIRWGEPFLHPEITSFIRYAKKKGLPVHITTNGSLTKDKNQELINSGLDSIIFSFQGTSKGGYEKMRGKHYDLVVSNILDLVKRRGNKEKPFIKITSTMTNETPEEIRNFKYYWEDIVDEVMVGKTNLSRVPVDTGIKKEETLPSLYRPCTEVWQKLSVDWDGKVSCCCADWDNFMTVGDISKETLKNIWDNSEDLKMFRKLLGDMRHRSLTLCSVCHHTYDEF
jgi:MoaA/NifB/PqqE/SkfB family radical SAM enzyme